MKASLAVGIEMTHRFRISKEKTVSALYPEAEEFVVMPEVFATGYMVGLIEWTCIKLVNPHLDWPAEQSVGIHVDVSHTAATPVGLEVAVRAKLIEIDGKRLGFEVEAYDDIDRISKGRHQRFIINKQKFDAKIDEKAAKASH